MVICDVCVRAQEVVIIKVVLTNSMIMVAMMVMPYGFG